MKFFRLFLSLVSVSILSACQQPLPDNQLLIFMQKEPGLAPYKTRIIVTPKYVRLDDGAGSKGYVLYNRKEQIARTVDATKHTVMIMDPKSVNVQPPFKLSYSIKDLGDMKGAPKIMGETPQHYQQYTNHKLCFDFIAVKDLMPHAVAALKEYQTFLARDSKVTFSEIPADMLDPCSIARNTFNPTSDLARGFPINRWRPDYSRILVDYKAHYVPDPKLFEIPGNYFTYSVQQIREGLVDMENRKIIKPGSSNNK